MIAMRPLYFQMCQMSRSNRPPEDDGKKVPGKSIWSKLQTAEFEPSGVSGAARGQGGGGARGGNSRGVFEQYNHLTPEQKRKAAKERRLAKK